MQFTKVSHKEWTERIKKELKIEDLSDKNILIDKNIRIDPFFERKVESKSKEFRREKAWSIVGVFDAESQVNTEILQSLNGGTNYLRINNSEKIQQAPSYFAEVFLNFLELDFRFSNNSTLADIERLVSFLEEQELDAAKVNLYCPIDSLASAIPAKWKSLRYSVISNDNLANELTNIIQSLILQLDQYSSSEQRAKAASKILIEKNIGSDIVKELAIKYAIEKLIYQVQIGFDDPLLKIKTFAHCNVSDIMEIENRYIDQAFKGLTASLAGYDHLHIEASSEENSEFSERISRNIHHLLTEESFLHKSSEAFIGSYQIEEISDKIVKEVWKNIKK